MIHRHAGLCLSVSAIALVACPAAAERASHAHWGPQRREAQAAHERALLESLDAQRLRQWHDMTASRPHVAGTPGDAELVDALVEAFTQMGLEVEKHPFWTLLARPVDASVTIVAPDEVELEVHEPPIDSDPDTAHDELTIGWSAYSATGDATGEVVYANYGRKEDFARLRELGVDVRGKVVVARFGGNYRGFKAHFAEQAGAAALIMYTDPQDSGFVRGLMHPEGGWANEHKIQRGSLLTLAYPGDPLTPFIEATEHARRLDPREVALPRIPVQPLGWGAAQEILGRMRGRPVEDRAWQGGLPFTYRLEGGAGLRVRVRVEQEREIVEAHNVVATLRGEGAPDEFIVIGGHHDAWGFGAIDPTCGLIVVLETARAFAEAAERGERPHRSILFAGWGAEEFGIIGSTEWVEGNIDRLREGAIAYINLDGAAMGPNFAASASPSLKAVIESAAADIPNDLFTPAGETPISLLEAWRSRTRAPDDAPTPFGNLGGGSDHVGFYCFAGVPSAGLHMGGAAGDAYHSNYDTLAWYRANVGDDYASALTLARVTALTATRLANADLPFYDPVRYARDAREHARSLAALAQERGVALDVGPMLDAAAALETRAAGAQERLLLALEEGRLDERRLEAAGALLRSLEGVWLREGGLPDRPWFRNMYASTDADSGYAAWMLPLLRHAVESGEAPRVERAVRLYVEILRQMEEMLATLEVLAQ